MDEIEKLVAKIFVVSAAALIVFAAMFGLTAKLPTNTDIIKPTPATVVTSQ